MDARAYFRLTDAIAAATSSDDLAAVRNIVYEVEMHPAERRAIERALRAREAALQGGDAPVPRPPVERAD